MGQAHSRSNHQKRESFLTNERVCYGLGSDSSDWRTVVQLVLGVCYLFLPDIAPVLQRRMIGISAGILSGGNEGFLPYLQEISPQFVPFRHPSPKAR